MYMPGRRRTASSPSRTWMSLAVYEAARDGRFCGVSSSMRCLTMYGGFSRVRYRVGWAGATRGKRAADEPREIVPALRELYHRRYRTQALTRAFGAAHSREGGRVGAAAR